MPSSPPRPAASTERHPGALGPSLGAAGTIAIWAATLLPWVRSGQVDRNLLTLGALAGRLGFLGALDAVSLAAIFPITAVPAVLVLLRLWRTAAAVAGLIGLLVAAAGMAAVALGPHAGQVVVHPAGPAVLVTAGLLLLAAAVVTIRSTRRPNHVTAAAGSAHDAPEHTTTPNT